MAVDAMETSAGADGGGAADAVDEVGGVGQRGAGKALYRRYRPQTFEEVIGQEHVTEPLMQALRTGRFGHAYLFSGPRGCGKTTSARILARCLNCEQGPTATPCGECASCVALATGGSGSVDVIEIDAASHGGVDDARDLREKASYGPAQSRYKVYIIDEAHMVTPQGFNALLKIVEEPPEHVKFVFATTEPEKVIGTIRSRTHHYPFRLVPPARLQEYLAHLCEAEGIPVEPGVLSFVIRAGGGSVRDSLSVLDQLMAGSTRQGLTYAGAAALLGFTEGELLDATIGALAARDGAGVFRQVDRTIETGQDPRRFVEDLLERLRDLIVVAAVGASGGDVSALFRGVPSDQIERMRQQAAAFGPGELSHAADVVNTGLTEMTGATSPRLQLELICARLLLPASAGEHGIVARVDRIERRLDLSGTDPVGPPPRELRQGAPGAQGSRGAGASSSESMHSSSSPSSSESMHSSSSGERAGSGGAADDRSPAHPSAPEGHGGPDGGSGPHAAGSATEQDHARGSRDASEEVGSRRPGMPSASHAAPPTEGRGRAAASNRAGGGPAPGAAGETPAEGATGPAGVPTDAANHPAADETPSGPPQEARRVPGGLDTDAIRRSWPDVLAKVFSIRRVTWTFLSEHAQVLDYDGSRLLLGISTRGLATTFRGGQHGEVVRQALIEAIGLDTRVEAIPADEARGGGPGPGGGPSSGGPGSGGGPSSGAPRGGHAAGPQQGTAAPPAAGNRSPAPQRADGPSRPQPSGDRADGGSSSRESSAPQASTPAGRGSASQGSAKTAGAPDDAGLEGLRAGAQASRGAERATGWQGGDDAPDWAQVEPPHDDDAWITPSAPDTTRGTPTPRSATPSERRPAGDAPTDAPSGRATPRKSPVATSDPAGPDDADASGPDQPTSAPSRGSSARASSAQSSAAQTPSEGLGAGALAEESPGPAIAERDGDLDGPPGSASPHANAGNAGSASTAGHAGNSGNAGTPAAASNSGIAAFRRARADQARRAPGLGGRSGPAAGGAAGARGAGPGSRQVAGGSADQAPGARNGGTGDDEVSEDDEVIEDLSAVGQPVIASVLGGVVIDENTT